VSALLPHIKAFRALSATTRDQADGILARSTDMLEQKNESGALTMAAVAGVVGALSHALKDAANDLERQMREQPQVGGE
jgi:hypothetical protein